MGAYLAKAGVRCVVLERELFPRPHVGESLVPSSTRVFAELGFLDKMEEARFPHKFGAVWTSSSSKQLDFHDFEGVDIAAGCDIQFQERVQPGVDKPYTYHVDRGKFDLLLLQHAHELGASVYEGVRVAGVDFQAPDPIIRFAMGRKELSLTAKIVIDASGRHTLLGNQLGLKVRDPVFDQYALHTWFQSFDRRAAAKGKSELGDFIFIHFMPIQNTWIWQIPITDDITSVGVVTQKKNFAKSRADREQFFRETIATRPELMAAVNDAVQLRPLKEEGDYSYAMSQIVGDRYLLIGDAGRFVDPIFSTGVSIALNSARFAHQDVLRALESGRYGRESFATFEKTIRLGTKNWYDFISVYYRLNILFTHFVNHPSYRLDVIKLLQGDVYDEEQPEVLRRMREAVTEAERNPKHIWHKLLNDLTSSAFSPAF